MPKPRLLLIGWDAADWKVSQLLLDAGQMPNLGRLTSAGAHRNVATIYPVLSRRVERPHEPACGKRADGVIVASQNAMLARQGRRGAELGKQQLLETSTAQLQRVRSQLPRHPEIRVLPMNYVELLAVPKTSADRAARFLGEPLDAAAAATVRPELRRKRI
jgi:hypothetical protein